MKRLDWIVLGTMGFVSAGVLAIGCGSDEPTCEDLRNCSDPCDDPTYAAQHPNVCPDAGTGGTGGTAGAGGSGGTSGEGGTGGTSGEAGAAGVGGTGGAGGEDAGDGGDADAGAAGMGGEDAGDADAPEEAFFCDPTWLPSDDPCVIEDDFGIFVSPSGTDGATCGTKAAPCATVTQGILRAKAEDKRVYACGDGGDYAESLSITSSSNGLKPLYGGFHCSDWSYEPTAVRAHLLPAAEGVALSIDGATGLEFNDFNFESRTATVAGTSSIAAIVNASNNIAFRNCEIASGNAAGGADGSDGNPGAAGDIATNSQIGLP